MPKVLNFESTGDKVPRVLYVGAGVLVDKATLLDMGPCHFSHYQGRSSCDFPILI